MRLPSDPKERRNILVLAGIGSVAVLYVLVSLVIKPIAGQKRARNEELGKLKEQINAAQRDVDSMMRNRDQDTKTLSGIVDDIWHKGYILTPRLGNYELGARESVEAVATALGLHIDGTSEAGLTQLPAPAGSTGPRALSYYTLRVQVSAGMHELVQLLAALEASNPFLCVSAIGMAPRANDPAQHDVSLDLQWPVWSDSSTGEALEHSLDDARKFSPPPTTGAEST